MTYFPFDEHQLSDIALLRMLLNQVTEEELQDEGYNFTYKTVTTLLGYISYLETQISSLLEDEFDA